MPPLYYLNVTVHVLAAILWLGGMFFLAVVGAPLLRNVEPPALRQQLFQQLGMRFRTVGWWSIGVLVATGIGNLYFRGLLHWQRVFANSAFWHTGMGKALAVKLSAVTCMILVSAIHDFVQGPRAGKLRPGSPEAIRSRRNAAWLARINALLGLLLVIAAVRLARGG